MRADYVANQQKKLLYIVTLSIVCDSQGLARGISPFLVFLLL